MVYIFASIEFCIFSLAITARRAIRTEVAEFGIREDSGNRTVRQMTNLSTEWLILHRGQCACGSKCGEPKDVPQSRQKGAAKPWMIDRNRFETQVQLCYEDPVRNDGPCKPCCEIWAMDCQDGETLFEASKHVCNPESKNVDTCVRSRCSKISDAYISARVSIEREHDKKHGRLEHDATVVKQQYEQELTDILHAIPPRSHHWETYEEMQSGLFELLNKKPPTKPSIVGRSSCSCKAMVTAGPSGAGKSGESEWMCGRRDCCSMCGKDEPFAKFVERLLHLYKAISEINSQKAKLDAARRDKEAKLAAQIKPLGQCRLENRTKCTQDLTNLCIAALRDGLQLTYVSTTYEQVASSERGGVWNNVLKGNLDIAYRQARQRAAGH